MANYVLLKWSDNIDISDDSPAEYLEKYQPKLTRNAEGMGKERKKKGTIKQAKGSIIGKI